VRPLYSGSATGKTFIKRKPKNLPKKRDFLYLR
jgi:hypothetical protein